MCPDNIDTIYSGDDFDAIKIANKNYLLYYLNNANEINIKNILSNIGDNTCRQYVAFKPESKKPDPRLFYIADFKTKLVLSDFEEAMDSFARNVHGS